MVFKTKISETTQPEKLPAIDSEPDSDFYLEMLLARLNKLSLLARFDTLVLLFWNTLF